MKKEILDKVKNNFSKKEEHLSLYATLDDEAIRLIKEEDELEIRTNYFHDIDRIIHSLSYTRYMDKTQVFSYLENDHISKRSLHVQLVSKIARTIARGLNLNEDLTEAIALGHDIGHTPIGHVGEYILNDICIRELGEFFGHNFQSVRVYMELQQSNLTIQVLDGIMCHNGEILNSIYKPIKKTKNEFLKEYRDSYLDSELAKKIRPMTLEGCIVRISDLIGYLGRDIEDAINIGVLSRNDIPIQITKVLGNTNKDIVNNIIRDILENSIDKPYIKLSDEVFYAISELKKFNYKNIYDKANSSETKELLIKRFESVYQKFLRDLITKNRLSKIYVDFLDEKSDEYINNTNIKRIVIDFISGMTDDYFLKMCQDKE